MEYKNLLLTEDDGILIVTINREKALNALNQQTIRELKHLFQTDAPTRDIKGVIITGAGRKAFVAGADIKEFEGMDASQAKALSQNGQDCFALIENFNKPVVAAVNGYALGGGCELAMACHLRVASDNARFALPEVTLGIIPGYGGTQRLLQYIGKTKAMELMMTAQMIKAKDALQLHLVNYVVSIEDLLDQAKDLIQKAAQNGPIAIAKVIEAVNAFYKDGVDGFAAEVEAFGVTAGTEDFKEGASAFIQKRKPEFKGE